MLRVLKWLKKRLRREKPWKKGERRQASLPYLPETRLPVTPRSSSEHTYQRRSPLFALPYEIRREILLYAFGERVIHMDHELHNDDIYRVECPHSGFSKGGWRGSICHRNPPNPPGKSINQVQPAHDRCYFGITPDRSKAVWPGPYPLKCQIGAVPWLRTCRQAYVEGVDVLYGTNTIHSRSRTMLMNLDKLILPQRLEKIKSVQLIWECIPTLPDVPALDLCQGFLEKTPFLFTGLKKMYISIQKIADEPIWLQAPISTLALLEMGDTMVRNLGAHVEECTVALPSTLYAPLRTDALERGDKVEMACDGQLERLWRVVEGGNLDGYWVRLGYRDMKMGENPWYNWRAYSPVERENWILYNWDRARYS